MTSRTDTRQYDERDAMQLDINGKHYSRHVVAMTAERLHSKSDIAAELGWRDMQIAVLNERLQGLAAENAQLIGWVEMERMTTVDKAEFTATDIATREIMARGVEGFIEFNRKLASDYPISMVAKALAITELNGEQYAALLRKGEIEL